MSNARCVLNDLVDKYHQGLTVTNNDALWMYSICLRLCDVISTYTDHREGPTLYDSLMGLRYAPLTKMSKRVYALSTVPNDLQHNSDTWHPITIDEMNQHISVFNCLVDFILEECPDSMLLSMYKEQEGVKYGDELDRALLKALLRIRKFNYFKKMRHVIIREAGA